MVEPSLACNYISQCAEVESLFVCINLECVECYFVFYLIVVISVTGRFILFNRGRMFFCLASSVVLAFLVSLIHNRGTMLGSCTPNNRPAGGLLVPIGHYRIGFHPFWSFFKVGWVFNK